MSDTPTPPKGADAGEVAERNAERIYEANARLDAPTPTGGDRPQDVAFVPSPPTPAERECFCDSDYRCPNHERKSPPAEREAGGCPHHPAKDENGWPLSAFCGECRPSAPPRDDGAAVREAVLEGPHSAACLSANDELCMALADLPDEDRRPGDNEYRCSCWRGKALAMLTTPPAPREEEAVALLREARPYVVSLAHPVPWPESPTRQLLARIDAHLAAAASRREAK